MPRKGFITRSNVTPSKRQFARKLRKQMTPAERVLWNKLRAKQIDGFHFRRQQIIRGFIVDFYCDAADLVIEVDGPIHEQQIEADQEREAVLKSLGLTVIRFTNKQVMNNMSFVLNRIKKYLKK